MSWLSGLGSIAIFKVRYEADSVLPTLLHADVHWKLYRCINISGNLEAFHYSNFLGRRGLRDNSNLMFWRLKAFPSLISQETTSQKEF